MDTVFLLKLSAVGASIFAILLLLVSLVGNVSKRIQKTTLIVALIFVIYSGVVTAFS